MAPGGRCFNNKRPAPGRTTLVPGGRRFNKLVTSMELRFSAEDEAFRREVAEWMEDALSGEFAVVRGRGGPGDESALIEERKAWEKTPGAGGWRGGWVATAKGGAGRGRAARRVAACRPVSARRRRPRRHRSRAGGRRPKRPGESPTRFW